MPRPDSFIPFTLRAVAVVAAAAAIALGAYVWADPFRAVRSYDNYYSGSPVHAGTNKANISLRHYLQHRDSMHYNAFIIGSSVAINYPVEAWRRMLPGDASPYHFDASAATPRTLRLIAGYLAGQGDLDHALVILPTERSSETRFTAMPFLNPPAIDPEVSTLRWHWTFIRAAFNREFLRAYIPSRLLGRRYEPAGKTFISYQPIVEDPLTNQESIPQWDSLIDADPERFLRTVHPDELPLTDNSAVVLGKSYTPADSAEFAALARIFRDNGTRYRIIVSPRRDKARAPAEDIAMLRAIFGTARVTDASGIDTDQLRDFYDGVHYRPPLAIKILESISK